MKRRFRTAMLASSALLWLAAGTHAVADPVERVVSLDVHNPGAFLLAMDELQASNVMGDGQRSLWAAVFDGSNPTSHVIVISYDDYQDLQDTDRRVFESKAWSDYQQKSRGALDLVSVAMGIQRITKGSGWHNHGYAMVYVMSVSDPATYAQEFSKLVDAMDSPGSIRLMEMRAGGEGTTHIVVVTAPDFVSLNEFTDQLQASRAYADFVKKVRGIRQIRTTSIYRRIKTW